MQIMDFRRANAQPLGFDKTVCARVYMVAADDAKDVATVEKAGFVDLGVIKGNIGDQNYTLGSDLDLTKYRAVPIWCKRFSVNFAAAPLRRTEASQNR
jgi:hypothetical protein